MDLQAIWDKSTERQDELQKRIKREKSIWGEIEPADEEKKQSEFISVISNKEIFPHKGSNRFF